MAAGTATGRGLTGTTNPTGTSPVGTPVSTLGAALPSTYTYGTGNNAQGYRAYGYGRGYRNNSYGRGYGYGRSQGNNRSIIARLRAVNMTLARVNHDYAGHRVRAMHQVSMAIRQLSHRSMISSGSGFAGGMGMGRGMGMGMGMNMGMGMGMNMGMGMQGGGGGMGGRQGMGQGMNNMNQGQSDAMMSQALRMLQGIGMQLNSQGSNNMGNGRASGHVQMAMRELNTALSIR